MESCHEPPPSSYISLLALTSAIVIAVGAGLILLSYLIWRGDDAYRMGA
jgi:hypothetical protein